MATNDSEYDRFAVEADGTLTACFQALDEQDALEQFRDAVKDDFVDVTVGDVTMQFQIDEVQAYIDD